MVVTFAEVLAGQFNDKERMKSSLSPGEVAGTQHLAITGEIEFVDVGTSISSRSLGNHFTIDHPVNGVIDSPTLQIDTGLGASSVARSLTDSSVLCFPGSFELARAIASLDANSPVYLAFGTGSQTMGKDVNSLAGEVGNRFLLSFVTGSGVVTMSGIVQDFTGNYNFTELGIFNSGSGGDCFFYRTFGGIANVTTGVNEVTVSVNMNYDSPMMDAGVLEVQKWFVGLSASFPSEIVWGTSSVSVLDTTYGALADVVYTGSSSLTTASLNRAEFEGIIPTGGATGSVLRITGLRSSDGVLFTYFGIAPVEKSGLFEVNNIMAVRIL